MEYQRRYSPRELFGVVPTGQYGRLYTKNTSDDGLQSLSVWVLPEGYTHDPSLNLPATAVPVFGLHLTSGCYSWLHTGPWIRDYEDLVQLYTERLVQRQKDRLVDAVRKEDQRIQEESRRIAQLTAVQQQRREKTLSSYPERPWSTKT